ncbi:OsmC family protein [Croceitalea dokdonensis DOKDO 023]|uniref:OsmC family protein n=1 Tax=Croceitalea dokdonensis DOKDO 023 TaxID=1300341 RepID=A0A0P7AT13_9FLAO|nr:OsmC family protein [Croceitalea dokdonensis DOKDO 023]
MASGAAFITDAPVDNQGLGQAFSPTDTIAAGLASCMLTIMGIKAKDLEVDLKGAKANVTKHMAAEPRRISKIDIQFYMPKDIAAKHQIVLERAAKSCPVHYSLHPDIEKVIVFHW